MNHAIFALAFAVTVAASLRSTWSPCGWSMLSTITPLGENGRGRKFRATAAWFVAGAAVGGAMLGGLMALLAVVVDSAHLSRTVALAIACVATLIGAASDARLGGFSIPIHRRQVNEDWLDLYRPWVYGAGFGWQIGTGFATYITSAAVYVMVVLAALTADSLAAFTLGIAFGTARGLAVLLGRHLDNPIVLREFHQRFESAGKWSKAAAIAVQTCAGVAAATLAWLAG